MINDRSHGLTALTRWRKTAVAFLAVLTLTGVSMAQSDRDLREENQRLQTRVNDMQRELVAAQERIAQLERDLQRLTDFVFPAKAGIQRSLVKSSLCGCLQLNPAGDTSPSRLFSRIWPKPQPPWIPACAGPTVWCLFPFPES